MFPVANPVANLATGSIREWESRLRLGLPSDFLAFMAERINWISDSRGILRPRRIRSEHGGDTVPMLAGHKERILSDHQILGFLAPSLYVLRRSSTALNIEPSKRAGCRARDAKPSPTLCDNRSVSRKRGRSWRDVIRNAPNIRWILGCTCDTAMSGTPCSGRESLENPEWTKKSRGVFDAEFPSSVRGRDASWLRSGSPIWRSAKVGGRTALLTKGEVNAYGEIEYIQAHLDEAEAEKNTAERAVRSFNREFPALPDGSPDLGGASPEDLHTYLRLLSTAYEAMGNYLYWLDILTGAESAVAAGKTTLADIYAAERQASERDAQHSMWWRKPVESTHSLPIVLTVSRHWRPAAVGRDESVDGVASATGASRPISGTCWGQLIALKLPLRFEQGSTRDVPKSKKVGTKRPELLSPLSQA
jgi:hypothetical protein